MARRLGRWPVILGGAAVVAAAVVAILVSQRGTAPSIEAFCREVAEAERLDESLASFDPDRIEPDVDALRRAASAAPDEIAPQLGSLLDLTEVIQTTLESTRAAQAEALESTLRERSTDVDAVTAAGRAVEDYTRSNCGIELNSTAQPMR